jgi:hypothetical protein
MRRYYTFIMVAAIAVGAVFVVRAGYYPVALVDGDFLLARDLWSQYHVVRTYDEHARALSGATSTVSRAALERAVLGVMIETALVHRAIRAEVGVEAERLVAERADGFLGDAELLQAARAVYGTDAVAFRRMVLVPQAEREMLTGMLFLRGTRWEDWLEKAKREARVRIFAPGLRWEGGEVRGE